MCFIRCQYCHKGMGLEDHTCDKEDILKVISELEQQVRESETKLNEIRERGLALFEDYSNNLEVGFEKKKLVALWGALKLNTITAHDYETFSSQWRSLHSLYILSSRILKRERNINRDKPIKFFLEELLNGLNKTAELFGYTKGFLTVDEFIEKVKEDR